MVIMVEVFIPWGLQYIFRIPFTQVYPFLGKKFGAWRLIA